MSGGRAQSFPKGARLRRRSDFLRLQRDGRRHHTEHFVVLKSVAAEGRCRIGITVSTRVGDAVTRNRVKRRIREVVRRLWRAIEPAVDVVIIAKPSAAQASHAEAAVELRRALGIPRD